MEMFVGVTDDGWQELTCSDSSARCSLSSPWGRSETPFSDGLQRRSRLQESLRSSSFGRYSFSGAAIHRRESSELMSLRRPDGYQHRSRSAPEDVKEKQQDHQWNQKRYAECADAERADDRDSLDQRFGYAADTTATTDRSADRPGSAPDA